MSSVLRLLDEVDEVDEVEKVPFWEPTNTGFRFIPGKLNKLLVSYGFSQYLSNKDRNAKTTIIRDDRGVIKEYNDTAVKTWVQQLLEGWLRDSEDQDAPLEGVLGSWYEYNKIDKIIASLPIHSEHEMEEATHMKFFRDDEGVCYLPFSNGVVEVTKKDIHLKQYAEVDGRIWEKSMINHLINIDDIPTNVDMDELIIKQVPQSPYIDFITYAFKVDIQPKKFGNDRDLGTNTDDYISSVTGFETALGYLLHRHIPVTHSKAIIFVDSDSSANNAEGGNGKSILLKLLKNIRSQVFLEGKKCNKSNNQFFFSSVTPSTEIVLIDDIKEDMRFDDLFNIITGDMAIEGKGQNTIIIDEKVKPKIAITSNYIIENKGTSYARRQHIVPFGNFFNKVEKSTDIEVEDIIGVKLWENDFTDENKNDFYIYHILCIQKYLNTSLVSPKNVPVSGIGSKEAMEWMKDWVDNESIKPDKNYRIDGISFVNLYNEFYDYFVDDEMLSKWDENTFTDKFFSYIQQRDDVEWNPHKEGKTKRAKRWMKGPANNQSNWVIIA